MTKAIRIHANGGPDVMCFEEIELPPPGPGEIRIRPTAIGVNFSDINVRRGGFYLTAPPRFPMSLGNEAAGVVAAVGAGVADVEVGERVAYAGVGGPFYESTGAYAEERNIPAACLIRLPREVSDRQAAALLVKGLTASTIVNHIFRPRPGQTILIHAAASGVALVLCQWCKHLGATVIGTVGSPEKARVAATHGCDHAILYRDTDFVVKVKALVSYRRRCGFRRRRQGHVPAVARLCAAVRHARQLRQCLGPCASAGDTVPVIIDRLTGEMRSA